MAEEENWIKEMEQVKKLACFLIINSLCLKINKLTK